MLPKEIKDQIAGEAAKLCSTTPLEDSEIYMAYEMGATAWAEKMLGFPDWLYENYFMSITSSMSITSNKWVKRKGDDAKPHTAAELLVYYINQIKK